MSKKAVVAKPNPPGAIALYHFFASGTKPIIFENAFPKTSPSAQENLKLATTKRAKLTAVLANVDKIHGSPTDLTAASLDYLPYITAICAQLIAIKGQIPSNKHTICWTSTLDLQLPGKNKPVFYNFDTLKSECVMVFWNHAIGHYKRAFQLVTGLYPEQKTNSDADSLLTGGSADPILDATKSLRKAAGVFDAVCSIVLPQLGALTANRPPETWEPVLLTMSKMCLANAQELAVATAIKNNKSNVLIAKLCTGVSDKFNECLEFMQENLLADNWGKLRASFKNYFHLKFILYLSLARLYVAKKCEADSEYGAWVYFLEEAHRLISSVQPIKPEKHQVGLQLLTNDIALHRALIAQELQGARHDNSKIYFAIIPEAEEASKFMVKGAFVIKAEPFDVPDLNESSFLDVPADDVKNCVVS